jgi:hypothetical protein
LGLLVKGAVPSGPARHPGTRLNGNRHIPGPCRRVAAWRSSPLSAGVVRVRRERPQDAATAAASIASCSARPVTKASSPPSAASQRSTASANTPSPAGTATSPCLAPSLRVQGGRQGGGQIAHGDVEITNRAATACTLNPPQSIALLSAHRTALDVTLTPTLTLQPVTIPAGKTARLALSWSNWCHANPGPLTISIAPAGRGGTTDGPFNGPPDYNYLPPCLTRNQPSTIQLLDLSLQR